MKRLQTISIAAGLALVAPFANAATTEFTGTHSIVNATPSNYNPTPTVPFQAPLKVYSEAAGSVIGGLKLNLGAAESAIVTYSVLGRESGFVNFAGPSGDLISEDDWRAIQETMYLLNIPGMRESIREGLATPIEECTQELDW